MTGVKCLPMYEIKCIADTKSHTGEGAFWDHPRQLLWWVDIPAGLIHCYDPASDQKNSQFHFGEPVACLAVRHAGDLVLGTKSGFWLYDPTSGIRTSIHDPESHLPANRFNDGTTDRQGRFWAGTMQDGGGTTPSGRFYRLDPDHKVHAWRDGFYTTNGLAFSPDGTRFYFADTARDVRTIWACDYDPSTGTPGPPSVFFDSRLVAGRPDGGTVDSEGCYWMAGVGGWQIYRLSPDGALMQTIDLPVERPSKPMFGGADLDILYFTSLASGITPSTASQQPQAGGLFAIYGLGIKGVAQTRFAG